MNNLRKSYQLQKIIGLVLLIPAAAFLLFAIIGGFFMVEGINLMLGGFMFSVLPILLGYLLFINATKKEKQNFEMGREKMTLELAAQHNGVLTQAVLAKKSNLTIAESGEILSELTIKGIATVEVNENGAIEYHFSGLK